ncbi:MAG: hypothetical protein S4CHLAM20_08080 [Chlamydiia bacterium]|nr:hypothetical protein [Chlamydiia bacterium]
MNEDEYDITYQEGNSVLESFLETVEGISDKTYQERVWVRGEGPEIDCYYETVNFFFDLGEGLFKNHKVYGISDDQYELLIKFRNKFDEFYRTQDYYDQEDLVNSDEWQQIIEMAKEVLKAFNYQKKL